MTCAVCGFPYFFPSEAHYADDSQFYCLRTCWIGETVTGHHKRRANWKPPEDATEPPITSSKPSWRD